jgi:hypothetical protein
MSLTPSSPARAWAEHRLRGCAWATAQGRVYPRGRTCPAGRTRGPAFEEPAASITETAPWLASGRPAFAPARTDHKVPPLTGSGPHDASDRLAMPQLLWHRTRSLATCPGRRTLHPDRTDSHRRRATQWPDLLRPNSQRPRNPETGPSSLRQDSQAGQRVATWCPVQPKAARSGPPCQGFARLVWTSRRMVSGFRLRRRWKRSAGVSAAAVCGVRGRQLQGFPWRSTRSTSPQNGLNRMCPSWATVAGTSGRSHPLPPCAPMGWPTRFQRRRVPGQ